jgi:cytochrome c peroxidase
MPPGLIVTIDAATVFDTRKLVLSAIRTVRNLLSHPSAVDARWRPLAPENVGRFQVPTLRNVDKRPSPNFVKAYGHNGYFKTLKSIVHFYNTRDTLRRLPAMTPARARYAGPGQSPPTI